jgi:hypothetical protein
MATPLRHRQTKEAANGYVQPKATAPHLDSTCISFSEGQGVPSSRTASKAVGALDLEIGHKGLEFRQDRQKDGFDLLPVLARGVADCLARRALRIVLKLFPEVIGRARRGPDLNVRRRQLGRC